VFQFKHRLPVRRLKCVIVEIGGIYFTFLFVFMILFFFRNFFLIILIVILFVNHIIVCYGC